MNQGVSTKSAPWTILKTLVLVLALVLLLLPTNRLWGPAYWFLLGIPLLVAAVRGRSEAIFLAWAIYAISFVDFVMIRTAADDLWFPVRASYAIGADSLIGFGILPTVRLQAFWYDPVQPGVFDWFLVAIHLSYYATPPLAGIALWRLSPPRFLRYAVGLSFVYLLGGLVHILLPTAPPWYAAAEGLIPPVSRVVYDLVHGLAPSFYSLGYKVAGGNEVAAMPSIHFATAYLIAIGFGQWRDWRWIGLAYAALMALSLTYLGEHYVVDLVAGAGLAWFSWWLAGRLRDASTGVGAAA